MADLSEFKPVYTALPARVFYYPPIIPIPCVFNVSFSGKTMRENHNLPPAETEDGAASDV